MNLDLFPETLAKLRGRAAPRVLMHVVDAGAVEYGTQKDLGKPLCKLRCGRCGAESAWLVFKNLTEAKRGVPCSTCNAEK